MINDKFASKLTKSKMFMGWAFLIAGGNNSIC